MQMNRTFRPALSVTSVVLNLLAAVPLLGIGALTLFSPDVPAEALAENTYVGLTLLAAAFALIYDLFRPVSGGWLILVLVVPFSILFNSFHISELVIRSREVGYDSFWSVAALVLIVLAVLSLVRGKVSSAKDDPMIT